MNSTNESILQEADRLVSSDRQSQYGSPKSNFTHIAKIASSIIGKELTAEDCAFVLLATKLARLKFKKKRDSITDAAGYLKVLYLIEEDNYDK